MPPLKHDEQAAWFVLRDLKRSNAKQPAYKILKEKHFEVFTPMKWHLTMRQGKRMREEIPFIQDLLFVHSKRYDLDPVVANIPTLQYRYVRGGNYCEPMLVPNDDMERFIHAVGSSTSPQYYLPEEITSAMYGRRIHIVGGPLDGYEGNLLTTRGSKTKRLIVELSGILAVGVEVNPEYIQFIL